MIRTQPVMKVLGDTFVFEGGKLKQYILHVERLKEDVLTMSTS